MVMSTVGVVNTYFNEALSENEESQSSFRKGGG